MPKKIPLLTVNHLQKTFREGKKERRAVDDISFSIEEGECLGLIGESGCGKSTTVNMIARLLKEDAGEIYFNGKKMTQGHRLRPVGRELQMVFQNPKDSFNPRYTLLEGVMEGARHYRIYEKKELKAAAKEMIGYVGLKESLLDMPVRSLSGGECQRAAIARALLCSPKLMICDEATSALDVSVQAQIIHLMRRLKKEKQMTFLFISHDLALSATICDKIAVMKKGKIVECGSAEEVLHHPRDPYTQLLLKSVLYAEVNSITDRSVL